MASVRLTASMKTRIIHAAVAGLEAAGKRAEEDLRELLSRHNNLDEFWRAYVVPEKVMEVLDQTPELAPFLNRTERIHVNVTQALSARRLVFHGPRPISTEQEYNTFVLDGRVSFFAEAKALAEKSVKYDTEARELRNSLTKMLDKFTTVQQAQKVWSAITQYLTPDELEQLHAKVSRVRRERDAVTMDTETRMKLAKAAMLTPPVAA